MPTQAGGTLTSAQVRHTRIRWKNAARGHPQRLHALPPMKRVSRVLACAVTCTARDCKQPFFRLAIVQRLFLPWFGARGWAGGLAVEADAAGARTSMMVVFPLPFGPRIRVSGGLKVMACAGGALVSKARAPRRANSAPPRGHAGAQRSATGTDMSRTCASQAFARHARQPRGAGRGGGSETRRRTPRPLPCAKAGNECRALAAIRQAPARIPGHTSECPGCRADRVWSCSSQRRPARAFGASRTEDGRAKSTPREAQGGK